MCQHLSCAFLSDCVSTAGLRPGRTCSKLIKPTPFYQEPCGFSVFGSDETRRRYFPQKTSFCISLGEQFTHIRLCHLAHPRLCAFRGIWTRFSPLHVATIKFHTRPLPSGDARGKEASALGWKGQARSSSDLPAERVPVCAPQRRGSGAASPSVTLATVKLGFRLARWRCPRP